MTTYAIVKISVPSAALEKLRAALEYQAFGDMSGDMSVRDYLDIQVFHFAAAFGPQCVSEVLEVGNENS
jgi:hypothetical protein